MRATVRAVQVIDAAMDVPGTSFPESRRIYAIQSRAGRAPKADSPGKAAKESTATRS